MEIVSRAPEELRLRFRYMSGKEAVIQRSVDLDEWEAAGLATADGSGSILFRDSESSAGTAYYRLARPVR